MMFWVDGSEYGRAWARAAAFWVAAAAMAFALCAQAGEGGILLPVQGPHTHELLRGLAASDDPAERIESVIALGRIADPADASLLREILRDGDARVRAEAVVSLGRLGPDGLAAEADHLLADPDASVRASFFRTMDPNRMTKAWARHGLGDGEALVRAAAARGAPAAGMTGELLALLQNDPSLFVQSAAWDRLAEGEGRVEALRHALAVPGTELFVRALHALRESDDVDLALIERILRGTRGAAVSAAVSAVGRARLAAAVPVILARMESYDALARRSACEVLGGFDVPGVVQALGRRLANDPDGAVARSAARALAAHPSVAADAALLAILRSDRADVLVWTLGALASRGTHAGAHAAAPLLSHADREVRTAAMIAIRRLDPAAARSRVDVLVESAGGHWTRESPAALRLLTAMGYRGHAELMKERLRRITYDIPPEVRLASLEGLIEMGMGDLEARVLRIATDTVVPPPPGESGWSHDSDDVRVMAIRYLARFGTPRDLPRVLEAFDETPPYAVRAALAELVTNWSGAAHEPIPRTVHVRYRIESLDPPAYETRIPPPGIRRVGTERE